MPVPAPLRLELLSPARDLETAKAAVRAGADAIYIGGPAFSARSRAHNSIADLEDITRYCHLYGVRVHVTVNTLLHDDELEKAGELLKKLDEIGVDVIILQDFTLLQYAQGLHLELHASTQCNTDTPEKLSFIRRLGFAQAVLPRELSLKDIAAFHAAEPKIRLEAFVAGALCVGRSGVCHISEFMTGRSANRGACAQICRLPMTLRQGEREIATGHLLSLKDNNALQDLEALIEAGVSSFKIEGRLKDPDYVLNITAAFSERLNAIVAASKGRYVRESLGEVRLNFAPDLGKTFNRGFTDHYLHGRNDALAFTLTPKFVGPEVARVQAVNYKGDSLYVSVDRVRAPVVNGDALSYLIRGESVNALRGFNVSGVSKAGKLTVLRVFTGKELPRPEGLSAGTVLYRNHDAAFLKQLSREDSAVRTVELSATLRAVPVEGGYSLELSYSDALQRQGSAVRFLELSGDKIPQEKTRLSQPLKKSLLKAFKVETVNFEGEALNLPLSLSFLNALRREAQEAYIKRAEQRMTQQDAYTLPESLPSLPVREIDNRLLLSSKARSLVQSLKVSPEASAERVTGYLMSCRNCLIRNHARCSKEGGKVTGFTLEIGRHVFPLSCDCKECVMYVMPPGESS